MAILGGSPLGLIGVMSSPTRDGMSTFNGGKSRNVNVNLYNVGREGDTEKLSKTNNTNNGMFSVFTSGSVLRPWPNINTVGKDTPTLGLDENYKNVVRRSLHNDEVYDTSILNIVEKLAGTPGALRPSDFAYLKDLGVYSNNRLVIARRFAAPMVDDIYSSTRKHLPLAVLITWRKPADDFIEITFGEEWEDAKADFTELLNNMAKDFMGGPLGTAASAAFGALPLPGFTEHLQRALLKKMGIIDEGAGDILPAGNPNLIKQAKRRKTIAYGQAGSGLKCTVSIKMIVEYEQKFISGIDPTIVFQDILANIVRFGTSPHAFYGLSKKFANKVLSYVDSPSKLLQDFTTNIKSSIEEAKNAILEEIKTQYNEQIKTAPTTVNDSSKPKTDKEKLETEKQETIAATENVLNKILGQLTNETIKKTVGKYRVEIEGILNSLTGLPSTPWHVTIGNPLRPVFCSGDLYMAQELSLKLGPHLAFNDLPSSVTAEFTLSNARAWGAEEIMSKFNTGNLRVVNFRKDGQSVDIRETINYNNLSEKPAGVGVTASGVTASNPDATISNNANNTGGSASVPSSGTAPTTTKENQEQPTVNSDPNSNNPPVQGETTPNPAPPQGQTQSNTGTSDFTVISEEVSISEGGLQAIYVVSGTYQISGEEVKSTGSGESEEKAKSDARNRAKKK